MNTFRIRIITPNTLSKMFRAFFLLLLLSTAVKSVPGDYYEVRYFYPSIGCSVDDSNIARIYYPTEKCLNIENGMKVRWFFTKATTYSISYDTSSVLISCSVGDIGKLEFYSDTKCTDFVEQVNFDTINDGCQQFGPSPYNTLRFQQFCHNNNPVSVSQPPYDVVQNSLKYLVETSFVMQNEPWMSLLTINSMSPYDVTCENFDTNPKILGIDDILKTGKEITDPKCLPFADVEASESVDFLTTWADGTNIVLEYFMSDKCVQNSVTLWMRAPDDNCVFYPVFSEKVQRFSTTDVLPLNLSVVEQTHNCREEYDYVFYASYVEETCTSEMNTAKVFKIESCELTANKKYTYKKYVQCFGDDQGVKMIDFYHYDGICASDTWFRAKNYYEDRMGIVETAATEIINNSQGVTTLTYYTRSFPGRDEDLEDIISDYWALVLLPKDCNSLANNEIDTIRSFSDGDNYFFFSNQLCWNCEKWYAELAGVKACENGQKMQCDRTNKGMRILNFTEINSCEGPYIQRINSRSSGSYGAECFDVGIALCMDRMCYGFSEYDFENVCSGHGSCERWNHCECFSSDYGNWTGESCSVPNCFGNCSGLGTCVEPGNCFCKGNLKSGRHDCDQCIDDSWDIDVVTGECTVPVCFGNSSESDRVCSGKGDCILPNFCKCFIDTNYAGETCDECQQGWAKYELGCTVAECNSLTNYDDGVCNNRGKCILPNVCNCTGNYDGKYCDECKTGWFDLELGCTIPVCYALTKYDDGVCYGRGKCIHPNVCNCTGNYDGLMCDRCKKSWDGLMCDIPVCFGLSDSTACNEHGTCVSAENCSCFGNFVGVKCDECIEGYDGSDCDLPVCDGLNSKTIGVCHDRGNCSEPGKCSCFTDIRYGTTYKGKYCEIVEQTQFILTIAVPSGAVAFLIIAVPLTVIIIIVIVCLVKRLKRFSGIKDLDLILEEQELMDNDEVAKFKINKKLFIVDYKTLKIGKKIGSGGGGGLVYICTFNNTECAFKVFDTSSLIDSQTEYEEFEREVEILSSFYGASIHPPRIGIVMEFCENGDLKNFLSKYRKKNNEGYAEKIRLLWQVAAAMGYLHSKNIIHRDLKTENVLVDKNEDCKLMDFGMSKLVKDMTKKKDQTARVGTSDFMAPECLRGDYNQSVDVFSFAILIFVLVEEVYQPYGPKSFNIEMKVAKDEEFRPKYKERLYPDWLSAIMTQNWKGNPEERMNFDRIGEILKKHIDEKLPGENEKTQATSAKKKIEM